MSQVQHTKKLELGNKSNVPEYTRVVIYDAIFRSEDKDLGYEFISQSYSTIYEKISDEELARRARAWCNSVREAITSYPATPPVYLAALSVSEPRDPINGKTERLLFNIK